MLARFGKSRARARRSYQQFVADGVAAGRRNDLIGGGLSAVSLVAKKARNGQHTTSGFSAAATLSTF